MHYNYNYKSAIDRMQWIHKKDELNQLMFTVDSNINPCDALQFDNLRLPFLFLTSNILTKLACTNNFREFHLEKIRQCPLSLQRP